MKRFTFLKSIALGSLAASPFIANGKTAQSKKRIHSPNSNILNYGAKGDGKTNDSSAVEAALKAHGEAYLPRLKNQFFLLGNIKVNSSKIYGLGKIRKLTKANFIFELSGKKAEISGLSFESQLGSGNGFTEIKIGEDLEFGLIQNNRFDGKIYSAIGADKNGETDGSLRYSSRAKNIKISNNFFKGYSRPVYLHSVENIDISHNTFQDTFYDAIRLRQNTQFCLISSNTFENIGTVNSTDSQDAVDSYWSGENLIISSNIIKSTNKQGLDIKGMAPQKNYGTGKVIISENHILNTKFSGILLSSGAKRSDGFFQRVHNFIIKGNYIEGCNTARNGVGDAAILSRHGISNLIISENIIQSNHARGISIVNREKDAPQCENVTIISNHCHNNGIKNNKSNLGIHLAGINNFQVMNNFLGNIKEKKNPIQTIGLAFMEEDNGFKSNFVGQIKNNIFQGNTTQSFVAPEKMKKQMKTDNILS